MLTLKPKIWHSFSFFHVIRYNYYSQDVDDLRPHRHGLAMRGHNIGRYDSSTKALLVKMQRQSASAIVRTMPGKYGLPMRVGRSEPKNPLQATSAHSGRCASRKILCRSPVT